MTKGKWVPVAERYPDQRGRYRCKITNNGREFEAERRLTIMSNGHHHWFGGCRPFTDHDVITHWLEADSN
tara:strand:- start:1389 stop:1598 length:210 start_codon:yes stop_codon:yes gene_type:complete